MSNALIEDLIRRVIARFELIGYDASQLAYDLTATNAEAARVKPFLSAIDAATPILIDDGNHKVRVRCIVRNNLGKPVKAPTVISTGNSAVDITGIAINGGVGVMLHQMIGVGSGSCATILPAADGRIDVSFTFASNPAGDPQQVVIDTGMKRFPGGVAIA